MINNDEKKKKNNLFPKYEINNVILRDFLLLHR